MNEVIKEVFIVHHSEKIAKNISRYRNFHTHRTEKHVDRTSLHNCTSLPGHDFHSE